MLDVFYFFFLKVWRYIQRFRERIEELGKFCGVRLLSQKRHLQPNPTTCVSSQGPTWHKEKTTLKVVL